MVQEYILSAPLLNTKFYSPALRHNLIPRPRLEVKLSESLCRRLTLVSAPPGFGKTTLVAAWADGLKEAFDHQAPRLAAESSGSPMTGWLHLDEGDNDFVRFFVCLVAALQRLEPDLGLGIQSQLVGSQMPPLEALITVLVNDLSGIEGDIILILDDYHIIRSEMIHKAITCLIEQQPHNMHLILITREDPPIPLPRLRVRDEMIEVREQDLRFSIQEATDFLRGTMGLDLSQESITTLTNRTEGWVAGLQIAGLSLQDRSDTDDFIASFCGHDRYIIDYLMEEVIRRQPEQVQDFLLRTSILNRLSASLCEEVVGDEVPFGSVMPLSANSFQSRQEILDHLERSNLFIVPLDHNREWYRYHHLFADLLRYRLMRQFPEIVPQLHRRAYNWYKVNGDVEEAMKHALAVPDHALAADLAEGYLHQLIRASRITACLNWIQHLPSEVIRSRAYLCSCCAWVYILNGDFEAANRYIEDCKSALEYYERVYSPIEQRWITSEEVCGHVLAIQAYGARLRGDFPQTIVLSQQALEQLPAVALEIRCVVALNLGIVYMMIWDPQKAWKTLLEAYEMARDSRENLFVAVTALCQLAGIAVWQGKLREAARLCEQAIQIGTLQGAKPFSLPAVAYAHGWLTAVHNQRNEVAAAKSHIEKALELVELVGPLETKIYARLFQSRIALDAGNFSEAEALLKWAEEKSQAYPIRGPVKTEWVVNRGRLFLENGDVSAAAHWLESQNVKSDDVPDALNFTNDSSRLLWMRLPEYVLLARLFLAKGEHNQGEALLERICAAAETWQYREVHLESLVFLAITAAFKRSGEKQTQALYYLELALRMADPEGYVRPFLIAGESIVSLLRQAIIQDIHPAYANKLLTDISDHLRVMSLRKLNTGQFNSIPAPVGELVEPVTERERQILRLLAAGLSSTEIAEALIISVHTTRSYTKSLYRKLDAHSRGEVIKKGTQLGLL